MNKIFKYLNLILGFVFVGAAAVMVFGIVRRAPDPTLMFAMVGYWSLLLIIFGMGLVNIYSSLKDWQRYTYKDKKYYVISEGLAKDPYTRKWKAVKIYKAEGVKTLFVRDKEEFESRFDRL